MKVGDLRAALAKWPDDTEVMVIDQPNGDLDGDVAINPAVNHPSVYVHGKSWHWADAWGSYPEGEDVLVIY